jgi:2-aminoadipate transaminase
MGEVLADPVRHRAALNYGGPRGSGTLIESIRTYLITRKVGGLTPEIIGKKQIIIGANGATSLLEGIAQVLKPGIVLTTDPMYYIYCDFLERRGYRVVAVPERADCLHAEDVERALTGLGDARAEVSFIYVVTVNNPSSKILDNAQREALVRLAAGLSRALGRKVPLILDRAYEELIHDPDVPAPLSGFLHDGDGIVYELGTLSKIVAPALRIGYLIGEDGPFLQALIQRTSDVGFSAPLINQEIASRLLDTAMDAQILRVRDGYREKALAVKAWIRGMLGNRVASMSGGQAGFYFYLTLDGIRTSEGSAFFRYLARTTGEDAVDGPKGGKNPRVVYIPGEFCVHPRGSMREEGGRQLRISYGFEEPDRLRQDVGFMAEAADYARRSG